MAVVLAAETEAVLTLILIVRAGAVVEFGTVVGRLGATVYLSHAPHIFGQNRSRMSKTPQSLFFRLEKPHPKVSLGRPGPQCPGT
jgi:hypothetical protein